MKRIVNLRDIQPILSCCVALKSIKGERTADAVGTSAYAVLFPYRLLFVFGFQKWIADIFGLSEADNECENVGKKPQS